MRRGVVIAAGLLVVILAGIMAYGDYQFISQRATVAQVQQNQDALRHLAYTYCTTGNASRRVQNLRFKRIGQRLDLRFTKLPLNDCHQLLIVKPQLTPPTSVAPPKHKPKGVPVGPRAETPSPEPTTGQVQTPTAPRRDPSPPRSQGHSSPPATSTPPPATSTPPPSTSTGGPPPATPPPPVVCLLGVCL